MLTVFVSSDPANILPLSLLFSNSSKEGSGINIFLQERPITSSDEFKLST